MPRNVEIKARIDGDKFESLVEKAKQIATDGPIELQQTDTFFTTERGRLKVREFADGTAELLFYERPDRAGPKTSEYIRSTCEPSVKDSLASAYSVAGVVRKNRIVYFVNQTRVHLDRVADLGTYLELEVVLQDGESVSFGESIANDLLRQLNVDESQLVSGAYFDLLSSVV